MLTTPPVPKTKKESLHFLFTCPFAAPSCTSQQFEKPFSPFASSWEVSTSSSHLHLAILPYGSSFSAKHYSLTTTPVSPPLLREIPACYVQALYIYLLQSYNTRLWGCLKSLFLIWGMLLAQFWLLFKTFLSIPLFCHHYISLLTGKLRHLFAH